MNIILLDSPSVSDKDYDEKYYELQDLEKKQDMCFLIHLL